MNPISDILKRTGLSQGELGRLCRVSRITIHHWIYGRYSASGDNEERLTLVLESLERLLELDRIPFPADISKEKRRQNIEKLIAHFDQALSQ